MSFNHANERLKDKQAFYADLNALEKDEDDVRDESRQASISAMQNAAKVKANSIKNLPRSASDTNLAAANKEHSVAQQHRPNTTTTRNERPPATLTKGYTFSGAPSRVQVPAPPSSAIRKNSGKRKRESTIKLIPEEQQVFKGLHFYFFPNDDKNPARALRITKALEYGATWQKEWNDTITHVIMDRAMSYDLLTRYLKIDGVPLGVIIVSENYPSECLSYRSLVDPRHPRVRVKGYSWPEHNHGKQQSKGSGTGSGHSSQSLQLKPAGKAVMARQPETQETDDPASSQPDMPPSDKQSQAMPATDTVRFGNSAPPATSTAEFDAVIKQARELQHLPLDQDDEVPSRPNSSGGPETDDDEEGSGLELTKKRPPKFQRMQDKFQCIQKHTGDKTETPNASTITILQQMADYYGQVGDQWRIGAYRKAIGTLRNHPTKVWTREEALKLPQIGDRLATKIEEIAFTHRLRRLENARAEPTDQVLQTFMQVYGAGLVQARKWVSQGFSTLDELLEKANLTDNQRVGVSHFEDFNTRIPRAEVEQHGTTVRRALQKLDPTFEVIIGGSYRRGAQTCGDIDCMITRPDTDAVHLRRVVLDQLVPKLIKAGFFVASLAVTDRNDGSKWHGASSLPSSDTARHPNPWRRIDLLLVPSDEMGAALIYFSGDDIFNRSMRLLASTKGMRLNQRGLYKDVLRGKEREKLSEGTLVEGKDEKKIFEVLGVPWRPPEHRIC